MNYEIKLILVQSYLIRTGMTDMADFTFTKDHKGRVIAVYHGPMSGSTFIYDIDEEDLELEVVVVETIY